MVIIVFAMKSGVRILNSDASMVRSVFSKSGLAMVILIVPITVTRVTALKFAEKGPSGVKIPNAFQVTGGVMETMTVLTARTKSTALRMRKTVVIIILLVVMVSASSSRSYATTAMIVLITPMRVIVPSYVQKRISSSVQPTINASQSHGIVTVKTTVVMEVMNAIVLLSSAVLLNLNANQELVLMERCVVTVSRIVMIVLMKKDANTSPQRAVLSFSHDLMGIVSI